MGWGMLDLSALKVRTGGAQGDSWARLPGHMGENNISLVSCMMHESVVKVDVFKLANFGLLLPWGIDS